jgi:hypothetical protein
MTGEFSLYCKNGHYRDLLISVKFLAIIVGNLFYGKVAKKWGRNYAINWSWGLGVVGIFIIYLA